MSIPINEIKEEARLAILRGLAAQVKFTPSEAATFDFSPLLVLAQRLGFRYAQKDKDAMKNNPFRQCLEATPEADYQRYPYRE